MLQEHAANKVTEKIAESHSAVISRMANEFLTFRLGKEEYGIEILKVQEIRGYDAITQIANAPEFIRGVVNLRGIIVPIIDMRIKFRMSNADYDQFTVVIILNVAGRVMGIVVDGVSDVIALGEEQMRPTPGLGSVIDTEYIMGLGTVDERMLILIDIEKLMGGSDMGLIEQSIN
ncbi:chemotaxis protein CheW [Nitrosomonas sp.]|uniref:chemotaxis protein CheW n=1 Tax=Nitrosomonas sp. TaxID=42353 RepID=UPI00261D8D17|nr:chemotaxis protein CheW [Nitrosomonas sp.]